MFFDIKSLLIPGFDKERNIVGDMGKKLLLAIFLLLCGILTSGSHTFAKGNVKALVIARGDYGSREYNLSPGPENDGENFRRILCQSYGESTSVTVLKKKGAESVEDVTSAIQTAFADSDSSDTNYFYYSGHGGELGMWLGDREFLSASDLASAFQGIQGKNFLVIDCCYSGDLISTKSVPMENFAESFIGKFEASLKRYQSRSPLTNDNFHVIVASAEGQESVQGNIGKRNELMGYFTSAMVVGCGIDCTKISENQNYACTAMADENRNGEVSFSELYHYVRKNLYASDAQVYPENDQTVFLPIDSWQIPQTVVTEAQIDYDIAGNTILSVESLSEKGGTMQAGIYQIRSDSELWDVIGMGVNPEVSAYKMGVLMQTGAFEFQANKNHSKAILPLSLTSLRAGKYLLLVNEKGGNTGCYAFILTLERDAESALWTNLQIRAAENFSVEKDGVLNVLADFGLCQYSNQYDCEVFCNIKDSNQKLVCALETQKIVTSWSEAEKAYAHFCKFQWNGTNKNGRQVTAGKYIIEIAIKNGSRLQEKQIEIQVESEAQGDLEEEPEDPPVIIDTDEKNIMKMTVTLSCNEFVYDGIAKCPDVKIPGLKNGQDYTVAYENHLNAGKAMAVVTGIGDYYGAVIKEFTILPMYINSMEIHVEKNVTYVGKACKPKVKVMYNISALKENVDYKLTYSNNKKIGYGKVTIQGIGNYTGKITKKFKILPQKPNLLKKAKIGNGKWKISWRKTAAVDGYELQYCTNSKFKKQVLRKQISGANKNAVCITVGIGSAKCYVRIRSYKKVNGKKWYSPFDSM